MLTDEIFMNIAYEIAKGSKCVSRHTGAVIVKDNRILTTGYNGTPAGYTNCDKHWNGIYTPEHHDWSYKYEIHAEMNAIIWAARNGIKIDGATMYSTYQPCNDCTRAIIGAGIKRVVYKEKYKHYTGDDAVKFFEDCSCEIVQLNHQ